MTPTTPADATPAAGETLQDRLRLCAQHCQKLYETDEGSKATIQAAAWRLNEAADALDASRAETDAMRAEPVLWRCYTQAIKAPESLWFSFVTS